MWPSGPGLGWHSSRAVASVSPVKYLLLPLMYLAEPVAKFMIEYLYS